MDSSLSTSTITTDTDKLVGLDTPAYSFLYNEYQTLLNSHNILKQEYISLSTHSQLIHTQFNDTKSHFDKIRISMQLRIDNLTKQLQQLLKLEPISTISDQHLQEHIHQQHQFQHHIQQEQNQALFYNPPPIQSRQCTNPISTTTSTTTSSTTPLPLQLPIPSPFQSTPSSTSQPSTLPKAIPIGSSTHNSTLLPQQTTPNTNILPTPSFTLPPFDSMMEPNNTNIHNTINNTIHDTPFYPVPSYEETLRLTQQATTPNILLPPSTSLTQTTSLSISANNNNINNTNNNTNNNLLPIPTPGIPIDFQRLPNTSTIVSTSSPLLDPTLSNNTTSNKNNNITITTNVTNKNNSNSNNNNTFTPTNSSKVSSLPRSAIGSAPFIPKELKQIHNDNITSSNSQSNMSSDDKKQQHFDEEKEITPIPTTLVSLSSTTSSSTSTSKSTAPNIQHQSIPINIEVNNDEINVNTTNKEDNLITSPPQAQQQQQQQQKSQSSLPIQTSPLQSLGLSKQLSDIQPFIPTQLQSYPSTQSHDTLHHSQPTLSQISIAPTASSSLSSSSSPSVMSKPFFPISLISATLSQGIISEHDENDITTTTTTTSSHSDDIDEGNNIIIRNGNDINLNDFYEDDDINNNVEKDNHNRDDINNNVEKDNHNKDDNNNTTSLLSSTTSIMSKTSTTSITSSISPTSLPFVPSSIKNNSGNIDQKSTTPSSSKTKTTTTTTTIKPFFPTTTSPPPPPPLQQQQQQISSSSLHNPSVYSNYNYGYDTIDSTHYLYGDYYGDNGYYYNYDSLYTEFNWEMFPNYYDYYTTMIPLQQSSSQSQQQSSSQSQQQYQIQSQQYNSTSQQQHQLPNPKIFSPFELISSYFKRRLVCFHHTKGGCLNTTCNFNHNLLEYKCNFHFGIPSPNSRNERIGSKYFKMNPILLELCTILINNPNVTITSIPSNSQLTTTLSSTTTTKITTPSLSSSQSSNNNDNNTTTNSTQITIPRSTNDVIYLLSNRCTMEQCHFSHSPINEIELKCELLLCAYHDHRHYILSVENADKARCDELQKKYAHTMIKIQLTKFNHNNNKQ